MVVVVVVVCFARGNHQDPPFSDSAAPWKGRIGRESGERDKDMDTWASHMQRKGGEVTVLGKPTRENLHGKTKESGAFLSHQKGRRRRSNRKGKSAYRGGKVLSGQGHACGGTNTRFPCRSGWGPSCAGRACLFGPRSGGLRHSFGASWESGGGATLACGQGQDQKAREGDPDHVKLRKRASSRSHGFVHMRGCFVARMHWKLGFPFRTPT